MICTAVFNNGFITDKHFSNLKRYGVSIRRSDPDMMRGYDALGPKIANLLSNKYLGVFFCNYMEAKHKKSKLTFTQYMYSIVSLNIVRPTFRLIGKILKMKEGN